MGDQLDFLCACDYHLHHGICNEDCICIEAVTIKRRHLLSGDFAMVTTKVRLSELEPPRTASDREDRP